MEEIIKALENYFQINRRLMAALLIGFVIILGGIGVAISSDDEEETQYRGTPTQHLIEDLTLEQMLNDR
ncbi:MAG: hypothetical protein ACOCQD_00705 [archaeon]